MAPHKALELDALITRAASFPSPVLHHLIGVSQALADRVRRLGERLGGAAFDLAVVPIATADELTLKRASIIACAVYLFEDPWFAAHGGLALPVRALLVSGLDAFSLDLGVEASEIARSGDLTEEFVRRCLAGLTLAPSGETIAANTARIAELERARRVKVAIDQKAAQAAAAKVSRE